MKKIIIDTDIGCDCDDAGALAVVHEGERTGLCRLLAVTISTENPFSASCADAVNRYYNNQVPIGQTLFAKSPEKYENWYGKRVADKFENGFATKRAEDAVRLLRRLLAQNEGEKITVAVIGSCSNVQMLLKSEGDDISPLDGAELMRRSVDALCLMGCYFPDGDLPEVVFADGYKMEAEYNIKEDVLAAQYLFKNCPVPIYLSHYTLGYFIKTGKKLMEKDIKNPVAESYRVHSNGNRESWDLVAVYFAIMGENEVFSLSKSGTVEIDDRGVSSFKAGEGLHHLILCNDYEEARRRIDNAMTGEF